MTIVVGSGVSVHAISSLTSKSRYSTTRLRRGPNSVAGTGSSPAGGQPLAGADASKKDIKHRFEITGKLGSGTYGKVSLAYDHKMEREVAVKLIKKSAIENKQDLIRIRREIRIMSMLYHPNIIQIYEVFENKDKIILVMEYASGGELYDFVSKRGCLPEAEARRIFRQITSAVLYCHKHKVAHRDLKLENILLDSRNNAKIADFGLSNYFGGATKPLLSTFCGSPLYASPEIINGTPYKGPEVDCWSLGILLYTLVYGSMPFDGRDFNRMVRQIKRGAYYEPETPSTASMLIRNMLRVNPDRRATIYDIASHWWLNLEENMPVIQELPENQVTDPTPLNERAEIMVVQELADETDVFMEFGHLSAVTRRKIEEFRRRRKEAEEYIENSPIKPPKAKRVLEDGREMEEMSPKEKSLRAVQHQDKKAPESPNTSKQKGEKSLFEDPLERLKALETRLQCGRQSNLAENSVDDNANKKKQVKERGEKNAEVESETKAQQSRVQRKSSKRLEEASNESLPNGTETKITNKKPKIAKTISGPKEQKVANETEKEKTKIDNEKAPIPTPLSEKASEKNATTAKLDTTNEYLRAGTKTDNQRYWKLETDSLNSLMNQVLEQMEVDGRVSLNLVARIQAHPMYDERPMVKELLESILQQSVEIQQEASKPVTKQQSKESNTSAKSLIKKIASNSASTQLTEKPPKVPIKEHKSESKEQLKTNIGSVKNANPVRSNKHSVPLKDIERQWNSVDASEPVSSSSEEFASTSNHNANKKNENEKIGLKKLPKNLQSIKTLSQKKTTTKEVPLSAPPIPSHQFSSAPKFVGNRETKSEEPCEEFEYSTMDDEEEEEFFDAAEEEELESGIDELAEVVEQVEIAITLADSEPPPMSPTEQQQQQPESSSNHLSTIERGLVKRISKGKYQNLHNHIEMYGRGVSMEAESPPPTKRKIGGPQPRLEHSPILFEKAKDAILHYPDITPNATDDEEQDITKAKHERQKRKEEKDVAKWSRTKDPDVVADNSSSTLATNSPIRRSSLPSERIRRTEIDGCESEGEDEDEEDENENDGNDEEDEEEEEEEEDAEPFKPRLSTIIGFRTIQPTGSDGVSKEAPIVKVKPQNQQNQVLQSTRAQANAQTHPSTHQDKFGTSGVKSVSAETGKKSVQQNNKSFPVEPGTEPKTTIKKHVEPGHKNYGNLVTSQLSKNQRLGNTFEELNVYEHGKTPPVAGAERKASQNLEQLLNQGVQQFHERRKPTLLQSQSHQSFDDPQQPDLGPSFNAYESSGRPTSGYYSYASGGLPSNLDRYEEEVYNAFAAPKVIYNAFAAPKGMPIQENRRERFEVYKTMAERANEQHPIHYRNNCGTHAERPVSAYMSSMGQPERSGMCRSRYDEPGNAVHRRSVYDLDPITDYGGATQSDLHSPYRRRVVQQSSRDSAEGNGRRSSIRSQSNDHLYMMGKSSEDFDDIPFSQTVLSRQFGIDGTGVSRLASDLPPHDLPPPIDYNYVNYYDSSGASHNFHRNEPIDLGMVPAKGILKNKQAYEIEPRLQNNFYHPINDGASINQGSRIRRHYSVDKGMDEFPSLNNDFGARKQRYGSNEHIYAVGNQFPSYGGTSGNYALNYNSTYYQPTVCHQQDFYGGNIRSKTPGDDTFELPTNGVSSLSKKRGTNGILNLARRRTTEVRMLPDSTSTATTRLAEEDHKRPLSPIERIKSLFGASNKAGKAKDHRDRNRDSNVAPGALYTGMYGTSIPISGGGRLSTAPGGYQVYQPSTSPGGMKRYTGNGVNFGASEMNRYCPQPRNYRNWYEDNTHL